MFMSITVASAPILFLPSKMVSFACCVECCYRDMKPENILLGDEMHIQITDFGSAKIVENPDSR